MSTIVTIAQSKGGAGKTTLAALLAPNLAASGYRVAVVDSDRNQSNQPSESVAPDETAFHDVDIDLSTDVS